MASKIFGATGLEGSSNGDLATILVATISDGDMAIAIDSNEEAHMYRFESSSTAAESSPQAVRPNDNAAPTAGVWILCDMSVEDLKVYGNAVIDGTCTITGALTLSEDLTIPDAGDIVWDNAPASDHTWSGDVTSLTAGEELTYGELAYFKSDGKLWLADADASTTMPGVALATATIAADATGVVLQRGWIRDDTWNWTVGGLIYASTTAGGLTQTAVSASGDQLQIVGWAKSADVMYFDPQLNIVEIK